MTQAPIPIRRQVFLLGFMGCGKTTVGKLLSQRLGQTFLSASLSESRARACSIARIGEYELGSEGAY